MSQQTLLAIARCPHFQRLVNTPDPKDPCNAIVRCQDAMAGRIGYQVPEPWRGDIDMARVLVISSNPGLGDNDDSRLMSDPDADIVAYHQQGFPTQFPRNLNRQGVPQRKVPFWSAMHDHVVELWGASNVRPGTEYALTEVVHCKSAKQQGVGRPMALCPSGFMQKIFLDSPANVVIVFGAVASDVLAGSLGPRSPRPRRGPRPGSKNHFPGMLRFDHRQRWVFFLPHPSVWVTSTIATFYSPTDIATARSNI